MAKKNKTQIRKSNDILWSMLIRLKGCCEICGSTINLEAHHMIRRELLYYRFNPDNGICLCSSCHKWSTECAAHSSNLEAVIRYYKWLTESSHAGFWQENKNNRPMFTATLNWYEEQREMLMKRLSQRLGLSGKITQASIRRAFQERRDGI